MKKVMKKTDDPLMEFYLNRNKSPEYIRQLFYKAYPKAEIYDKNKSGYSGNLDSGMTE